MMVNFKWGLLIVGLLLVGCNVSLETSDGGFYIRKQTVNVDGNLKKADQEHLKKIDAKKSSRFSLKSADSPHSPERIKSLKPAQFTIPKNQKQKSPSEIQPVDLNSIIAIKKISQPFSFLSYYQNDQNKARKGEIATTTTHANPFFGVIKFSLRLLAVVFLISAIAILVYAANYGIVTPGASLILASYLLIASYLLFKLT